MLKEIIDIGLKANRRGKNFFEKKNIFQDLILLNLKISKNKARNTECTANIFGFKITGYDYWTLEFLYQEVFLSEDYFFIAANPNPVIIDCGANIGFSVLYFKKLYPEAEVLAFEPNPHAFNLLEKNITQNQQKYVSLLNVALSDKVGSISFYITSDNVGTLVGSFRKDRGGDKEIKVECSKLSDYILKLGREVDLIKIDVEGAETKIIDDLIQANVLRNVKELIVEYHHRINNEPSHLSEFLKKFEDEGFEYNLKSWFTQKGQFQDVLIRFYRTV